MLYEVRCLGLIEARPKDDPTSDLDIGFKSTSYPTMSSRPPTVDVGREKMDVSGVGATYVCARLRLVSLTRPRPTSAKHPDKGVFAFQRKLASDSNRG